MKKWHVTENKLTPPYAPPPMYALKHRNLMIKAPVCIKKPFARYLTKLNCSYNLPNPFDRSLATENWHIMALSQTPCTPLELIYGLPLTMQHFLATSSFYTFIHMLKSLALQVM